MGGYRHYNSNGGFSAYLYRQDGDAISFGGITIKVITRIDDDNYHSPLPYYSNTASAYFKRSSDGDHPIEQLRIYKDRKPILDFDWGHKHLGFPEGVVHVHILSAKGNLHADKASVRYMNNEEIAKYGPIIKTAFPSVKFRP